MRAQQVSPERALGGLVEARGSLHGPYTDHIQTCPLIFSGEAPKDPKRLCHVPCSKPIGTHEADPTRIEKGPTHRPKQIRYPPHPVAKVPHMMGAPELETVRRACKATLDTEGSQLPLYRARVGSSRSIFRVILLPNSTRSEGKTRLEGVVSYSIAVYWTLPTDMATPRSEI